MKKGPITKAPQEVSENPNIPVKATESAVRNLSTE